jgi:hypothetical protein
VTTIVLDKPIFLKEQADANADVAAYGQLWVDTATPNTMWFTDDAGTDFQLGVGGTPDIDSVTGQATWGTAATKETADIVFNAVEADFHNGAGPGYPLLSGQSTCAAGACDAAAEYGRLCFDTDADTDGSVMVCTSAGWKEVDDDGAGGGEANTISSPEAGGLDLVHSTSKSGVDLRTVDADSDDFDLAADILSIDDTNWATQGEVDAKAPIASPTFTGTLTVNNNGGTSDDDIVLGDAAGDSGDLVNVQNIYDDFAATSPWLEVSSCGADTAVNSVDAAGTITCTANSAHTADEVGTKTTGDLCTNDGSSVNCTINTEAELETALDALDLTTAAELAAFTGQANIVTVGDLASGSLAAGFTAVTVPLGGTGATSFTDGGILVGATAGAIEVLAAATNGQIPIGSTGSNPVPNEIDGTASEIAVANAAGTITLSLPATVNLGGKTSFEIPNSAAPVVETDGEIGIDTTDNGEATAQFVYDDDAGTRVITDVVQVCHTIENLAAADDDKPFWLLTAYADVTLISAACVCVGTCNTEADVVFEVDDGTPAVITGTVTCEDTTTGDTNTALSGGETNLDQYELLRFDVTNAVSPETDDYSLCVNYRIVRS